MENERGCKAPPRTHRQQTQPQKSPLAKTEAALPTRLHNTPSMVLQDGWTHPWTGADARMHRWMDERQDSSLCQSEGLWKRQS